MCVVASTTPLAAGAASQPSLSELKQQLTDARAAATAAAERYSEAWGRHEQIVADIDLTQDRLVEERARAGELRLRVRRRAVEAYVSRGSEQDVFGALLAGRGLLASIRKVAFLERVNARDDLVLGQLRALDEDLEVQKLELEDRRVQEQEIVEQLESEKDALDIELAKIQRSYDALRARLAREEAERALRTRLARARSGAGGIVNPGGGTFTCPVSGGVFNDDFGDPRSGGRTHKGNDIFAPYGTPVVAVKAGSVSFANEGLGGLIAYLAGDDGVTYYYAHFSAFAGGARRVGQGEVIGYVGTSGNVIGNAAHLHFEIRTPAGFVNPFPTLATFC